MKILIEESVLRQALDYTERVCGDRCNAEYNPCEARDIAAALRTALDAAEKVEPVAWYADHRVEDEVEIEWNKNKPTSAASWKPLFSYPESNGYSIGVIDSNGDIYPEPPPAGTVLYTHPAPAVPEAFYRAAFNAGIEAAAKVCEKFDSMRWSGAPEEIRKLEMKP